MQGKNMLCEGGEDKRLVTLPASSSLLNTFSCDAEKVARSDTDSEG